jgi:hypothetical protein
LKTEEVDDDKTGRWVFEWDGTVSASERGFRDRANKRR